MAARVSTEQAGHIDTLIADSMRGSEEYLKEAAKLLAGTSVNWAVQKGRADEVIVERAAANKETLIAMATHGRSGIGRWLLGSVAEKVMRGANNPVLLVRATDAGTSEGEALPGSIIVTLDGSELAETVLPAVVELARALSLKVVLMRSYSLKQLIYSYEDYMADLDEVEAKAKSAASSYLEAKVQQLKNQGLVSVLPVVAEGEAAESIIEIATGSPGSLIAMCTHGRSGFKRWVLGSVTEKVVRHSNQPILVIRAA